MVCQGCGHEFSHSAPRCPRCNRSIKLGQSDSRLIEFPRKPKLQASAPSQELPAWRLELNEKVRAVRARKGEGEAPQSARESSTSSSAGAAAAPAFESGKSLRSTGVTTSDAPSAASNPNRKTSNIIVEAALSRVRKATETANRASLPKIEPARPARNAMGTDRQATARALEPASEPLVRPGYIDALPEYAPAADLAAPAVEPPAAETFELPDAASIMPIDELEPVDYLEAEVRKVDKALGLEFSRNESPSVAAHIVINVVDLAAIAISSSPFFALMALNNGSFTQRSTRIAAFAVVMLVSFLYLAITQSLGGKTFGMMATNTRVVEAQTFEHVSGTRAMVRSAAYLVSLLAAGVGILWAVTNRKHRGWQDLLSGTLVARDF
jgi:uncharacterized RDD family membrane protein YckC